MRIVAIGDVGVLDDMIHIGDEAMFEEFVRQLRARGAGHIIGISASPADTAERYGIEAIPQIGFPDANDRPASDARRESVLRAARGEESALMATDPAHRVIAAIRSADGVAITGGGNLASTWPVHIYERSTIGALASLFRVPLVISGQTIGPALTPDDAEVVRELLSSATRVGLRETASVELCTRIGVPLELLHATTDDASFLGLDDPTPTAAPPPAENPAVETVSGETPSAEPRCLVSLSGHLGAWPRDESLAALAALLDAVHTVTGLAIDFLPHFGSLNGVAGLGDDRIHAAVRDRMVSPPGRSLQVSDSLAAARLARTASLVLTSRYHPAVFAAGSGVPIIGIPVDDYTGVKLRGALGNLGQTGVIGIGDLITALANHDLEEFVSSLWSERQSIRARASPLIAQARQASAAWWDAVAADFTR